MSHSLNDIVEHLRREHFADDRLTLGEVTAIQRRNEVGLTGTVLDRSAAEAFVAALRRQAPGVNWRDELTPLVAGPDYGWAVLDRAVADLRREPRSQSERVSQVLFGETVEVLRQQEGWSFVRTADGYLGWMHSNPLWTCSAELANTWHQNATHVVTQPLLPCYTESLGQPEHQITLLPFGTFLHIEAHQGAFYCVRFPSGVGRWVPATGVLPLSQRPAQNLDGLRKVVAWTQHMLGVPYLWGGRSAFGYDCSGLVQVMYKLVQVALRRDADQQATQGEPIEFGQQRFGDLVFFDTNQSEDELETSHERTITHVGMMLEHGDFLHASSRHGGVCYGSLNSHSPIYLPSYPKRLICIRRYV